MPCPNPASVGNQRRSHTLVWLAAIGLLAGSCRDEGSVIGNTPPPPPAGPPAQRAQADLRGLGAITVAATPGADGTVHTTYTASTAANAVSLASKRLADLRGFGDLRSASDPKLPGTLLELPGTGAWLLGVEGAVVHELFAPDRVRLTALATGAGASAWKPVTADAHPRWLDGFDNAGFGFWSLGGGVLPKDLDADLRWFGDNGFTMCVVGTNEDRAIAPGIIDTSVMDFYRAKAAENKVPYRMLLWWQHPQRPLYTWNLEPLPHLQSASGGVAVDNLYYQRLAAYDGFEPIPATDAYVADARRRIAAHAGTDPNFIGHHGSAEVPRASISELAGVAGSPHIQALWRQWLRDERKLSLAEVGERHCGSATAFASWDDVPIPGMEDFAGWQPGCIDLRGSWLVRPDPERAGTAAGWFANPPADGWSERPIQDPLLLLLGKGTDGKPASLWLQRTITLDAAQVAAARHLHIARTGWHGSQSALGSVWINGTPLTALTDNHPVHPDTEQCFATGTTLHAGENRIVIDTLGSTISGHIFLGPAGRWAYPSPDRQLNARWSDGTEFCAWLRLRWLAGNLAATRSGDPFRPQKIMAPWEFLGDAITLGERYGAYVHETGMGGAVWCPWFPRYAQARRQPTSSEPGGPADDAFTLGKLVTNYLMMGDDAVDIVFHNELYRSKPELAAWIRDNRELMRCLGKSAVPVPPVAVLRSTRVVRLGQEPPWSWDITRGELQAVGRDGVDLEPADLAAGRVDPAIRVIVDAGSSILEAADVAAIERWVHAGGTFVAQHHTGRHTPERADSWPIARLTGLRVVEDAAGGRRLRFAAGQTLWPKLAGRELDGWGTVLDWLDRDRTGSSVALEAAADGVEVIATWAGAGDRIAVARRRLGAGQVITLGSTFWRNAKDDSGRYVSDLGARPYLDELLTSLAVPRTSTVTPAGKDTVFAFRWRSKNGIYDVYPVARIDAKKDAPALRVDLQLAGRSDLTSVSEVSALGHPARAVSAAAGGFTLAGVELATMQSRVFIAPRSDMVRAGLDWIDVLQTRWRPLPAEPPAVPPARSPAVLALAEDWSVAADAQPWGEAPQALTAGRTLRLGSYAAMGFPRAAIVHATRTATIPAAWAGQRISLVFSAEHWFWGIGPKGRLWIDGKPAAIRQPITPDHEGSFVIDLGVRPAGSSIALAVEIDDRLKPTDKRPRPSGVTGLFYLEAVPVPLASQDLLPLLQVLDRNGTASGPADHAKPAPADCLMLEARLEPPPRQPGSRLFLEWDYPIERLQIGSLWIEPPTWMRRLDVSRLITGATVLRTAPALLWPKSYARIAGTPPGLRLVQMEGATAGR